MIEVSPDARYAIAMGAIFPDSAGSFGGKVNAGEWPAALSIVRRAHRLEVLEAWWEEGRIGVDELRAMLPGAWRDAETDTGLRFWPLFRDVGFCGQPVALPDWVIGFRGGQRDDPPGMVWGLDLEVARRVALRWPRSAATNAEGEPIRAGVVTTARIPRAQIHARWVTRTDTEVIAHPDAIEIMGRERIEERLEAGWHDATPEKIASS